MREFEVEKSKLEAQLKSIRHGMSNVSLDTSDLATFADPIEDDSSCVALDSSVAVLPAPSNPPVGALQEAEILPAIIDSAASGARLSVSSTRASQSQLVRRPHQPDRFDSVMSEFQNHSSGFKRPHSPPAPAPDEIKQLTKKQKLRTSGIHIYLVPTKLIDGCSVHGCTIL